jgi:hypothetical protein
MVRNRVRRVAGMERDDRGPLQRNPIDRSPRRRDHDGRNDAPRLGTNRSAASGLHMDGSILFVGKDQQNHRRQFDRGEQGRLV